MAGRRKLAGPFGDGLRSTLGLPAGYLVFSLSAIRRLSRESRLCLPCFLLARDRSAKNPSNAHRGKVLCSPKSTQRIPATRSEIIDSVLIHTYIIVCRPAAKPSMAAILRCAARRLGGSLLQRTHAAEQRQLSPPRTLMHTRGEVSQPKLTSFPLNFLTYVIKDPAIEFCLCNPKQLVHACLC